MLPDYPEMWSSFTEDEQLAVARDFLSSNHPFALEARDDTINALAKAMRFRPVSISRKSKEEKAIALQSNMLRPELRPFMVKVIGTYLLEHHYPLVLEFLTVQGIPHERGIILKHSPPPTSDSFLKGITAIQKAFPSHEVGLYLSFLAMSGSGSDFWAGLPAALKTSALDLQALVCGLSPEANAGAKGPPVSAEPEDNEEFTTLDNILIHAAVGSALQTEGSLSPDQLEDLTEEVIALSQQRLHRCFHRGYFHALFGKEPSFEQRGENHIRRIWYLTGVLFGLLRNGKPEQCLVLIKQQRDLFSELIANEDSRCGSMLLPHLYRFLLEGEEVSLAVQLVENHSVRLRTDHLVSLMSKLYEDGAARVRRGETAEATLLLRACLRCTSAPHDLSGHGEFTVNMLFATLRKLAQIAQSKGDFAKAKQSLEALITTDGREALPHVLADLGLIAGGFRSLTGILPTTSKHRSLSALLDALSKGENNFIQAVKNHGEKATNAHFCLGMMNFLRGPKEASTSAAHFQVSLEGMLGDEEAYTEGGLLTWNKFVLLVSLLESSSAGFLVYVADLLKQVVTSRTEFPIEFWSRCLQAAVLSDDAILAEQVGRHVLNCQGRQSYLALRESGVLATSRELRQAYLDWLLGEKIALSELWQDLKQLAKDSLKACCYDQTELALDHLEHLVKRSPSLQADFVEFLSCPANYSPVWEELDVETLLLRIWEALGRLEEAADLLRRRFYRLRAGGAPDQLVEAANALEHLATLKQESIELEKLRALLPGEVSKEEPGTVRAGEKYLRNGIRVSIVYIGGDETQREYGQYLRTFFEKELPGLHLEYHVPGWNSSWNLHLERLKPIIERSDGVVLSYLVRTNLGRHVRLLCNEQRPRFSCTGKGRTFIRNCIRNAAVQAAERKYEDANVESADSSS